MIRFDRAQLVAFIRAVDRHLRRPVPVVVIGGAAAAIAYDSGTKTADIDLYQGLSKEVLRAAGRAREETGLAIAVGAAAIADLPYNYEERLRPGRGLALANFQLVFPDKYDLALAKTARGYQHDIDAVEGIHRRHPLALKTFVRRFEAEMSGAIVDPRKIRLNVAMVVARLHGLDAGRRLAARWGVPAPGFP